MDNPDEIAQADEERAPQHDQQQPANIDVQQLAERVYRLMLADLRLERARGERAAPRKVR